MQLLKNFVKSKKISYSYLSKEMGYTTPFICAVLNGKRNRSQKFEKLFVFALTKFAKKDIKELDDLLERTDWISLKDD